jgi:hypothetical protein
MASAQEKGLALEEKLCRLFETRGYQVMHNTRIAGRSGVEHQIDVLAEYRCPLHVSKVVVEAKSYSTPIDKDRIMKLIQIVGDIGADRGIIITTSYFTPSAIKTAEGHNIDLWDREQLVKLLGEIEVSAVERGLPEKVAVTEVAVKPSIGFEDARSIVSDILDKRSKGGFLGRGKILERLEDISLVYNPYYEVELQAGLWETEKTGLISKRTVEKTISATVMVDAVQGDLVTLDENGVSYAYSYLRNLDEDEIRVLRSYRSYSIADLMALGYSEGRAKKITNSLMGKGLVKAYKPKQGPMVYSVQVPFPLDPRLLSSVSGAGMSLGEITTEGVRRFPLIEASSVVRALESYWMHASVKKIRVVYYPYYVYTLTAEDGSRRTEFLDGRTGKLNEALSKLRT